MLRKIFEINFLILTFSSQDFLRDLVRVWLNPYQTGLVRIWSNPYQIPQKISRQFFKNQQIHLENFSQQKIVHLNRSKIVPRIQKSYLENLKTIISTRIPVITEKWNDLGRKSRVLFTKSSKPSFIRIPLVISRSGTRGYSYLQYSRFSNKWKFEQMEILFENRLLFIREQMEIL